jgi:hypothetical protein
MGAGKACAQTIVAQMKLAVEKSLKRMSRTLNAKYFNLLARQVQGDEEVQSYQVVEPNATMVLHSLVDGNPIAAVTFLPRVRGGNAKTVITRRAQDTAPVGTAAASGAQDEYAYFHGFTNVDNEEFVFVIHNLTDFVRDPAVDTHRGNKADIGYLKIDILAQKRNVTEIDMPDIGVNQVNELRPSESYVVESDQRTGHKTMILRGEVDAATGRRITVAQDEAAAQGALNDKTRGSYFYINVVASANFPAMVALLRHTTWRAVDVFTRRIPKANGRAGAVLSYSTRFADVRPESFTTLEYSRNSVVTARLHRSDEGDESDLEGDEEDADIDLMAEEQNLCFGDDSLCSIDRKSVV